MKTPPATQSATRKQEALLQIVRFREWTVQGVRRDVALITDRIGSVVVTLQTLSIHTFVAHLLHSQRTTKFAR